MPAAVPLIAVVAGGVASAAVGGGIIGAIVGAGAAFVVSTIGASVFPARRPTAPSTSLRPGDDPTAPGAGRTQSFRQPITEHQIVFGRCKVGGPIVFIHSATDDAGRADGWFYAVVVLAAHRVRAIGEVWLGDTLATDAKFAGLVRIDRHLGDPDQVANANLIAETGGKWTADHRGRGRAYVVVRLKITAEAFPSGPPNIAALVEGADTILDPRTGATGWSDNPALCLAWYLTAPFGWKASWDDIDIPALIAAANICDELIGTRAGVTERRYTVNGRVSLGEGKIAITRKLVAAMAGALVVSGGRFFIHAGGPALPAATLTSDDLRGDVTIQGSRPRRDLFNGVRAVYVDPAKNWQPTDAPPLLASNYVAEDGGEQIYRDLEYPLTTSVATVQRLMKAELERIRRQREVAFPANLSALRLRPWDGVTVALGGGARGLIMQGVIQYTGAANAAATVLTLGDGGTTRNGEKLYLNLQVTRQIQSDWLSEADIGILARNLDSSLLDLRLVSGFTIGLRTLGDGRGFEDTTLILGRILNNRYGLDAHCATATAWNTSIRYYGGHFACATGINPTLDRFGVRFSRQVGAYNNHNRHIFDGPNFELRQLDPNVAIPFLNETSGTAIIARGMRMEACSPIAARHAGAATDCEYEVAWAQTYAIGIDYTATATRAGNAVYNRHRAPASRLTRLLANIPNLRAAAFRHSNTEIGVEGACIIATSTTTETTMAALSWNGLDGIAATGRGLLLNANRGVAFVVQTTHAKEFALAHWLVGGADGGRLCVRCFDGAGTVRENQPQDVLASGTTMQWDTAAKSWQAGAVMQDSSLNRRQTVRLGPGVAFTQIGIIGFDGQIELEALRLYGLPEDAPAILYGCPSLPAGTRTLALETIWDLPSLGPGATANVDVSVPGARRGDFADASLDTSSIAFVLDCHVWSNNSVRVTARNVSASTVDLAAAPLAVQVTKRRLP